MSDATYSALKRAKALAQVEQQGFDTGFIQNQVYYSDNPSYSTVMNIGHAGDGNDFIWNDSVHGTSLYGNGGDDIMMGGLGADRFYGGTGNDTVAYVNANSGVTVHMEYAEYALNGGYAAGDRLDSIENLIGSKYDDNIYGTTGANRIYGGDGFDTIYGGAGIDQLHGGAGDDTLYAGSIVRESNFLKEQLSGGDGNDTLYAGANMDVLDGGGDYHFALGLLSAGGGGDVASYALSNAAVTVNLATGVGSGGFAAGDTYSGIEDVSGSEFNDTLTGNNAVNILEGGRGNDTMTGGGGHDTFWYSMTQLFEGEHKPNFGFDTITDFQVAFDGAEPVGDQLFFADAPSNFTFQQTFVGNDSIITSAFFDGAITLKNFHTDLIHL